MKPDEVLSVDEMEKERTPDELVEWVQQIETTFSQNKEFRKFARLKTGLVKKFFEEIRPLCLFVKYYYSGNSLILCKPNLGNQKFDATIKDLRKSPHLEQKIEITTTANRDDKLRRIFLSERGYVWMTGKIVEQGTRNKGRKIQITPEVKDHFDVLNVEFQKILERAENKIKKEYNKDHILLIGFDDSIGFYSVGDSDYQTLDRFSKEKFSELKNAFRATYLVGLNGRVVFEIS